MFWAQVWVYWAMVDRPSISKDTILGSNSNTAAMFRALAMISGTVCPARIYSTAPTIRPMNMGSPKKPIFSFRCSGSASSLLKPGILS